MNSHSGSGLGGSFIDEAKKTKKCKGKRDQDVMKDIWDSDLF